MFPKLRCAEIELASFASRYQFPTEENEVLGLRDKVMRRGCLTKDELRIIAHWKATRAAGYMENNQEEYVREITAFSFTTKTERARIEVLTNLDGVQWPTASVILHFFHQEPYPIMDFRALWSVSLEVPAQYSYDFWWTYVVFCRSISTQARLDMRKLDRALWQYSKENQPSNVKNKCL